MADDVMQASRARGGGGQRVSVLLFTFTALAFQLVLAQSPRWTWTYDGPAAMWDQAWRVRCGQDSGVYVCGDGQANAIPLTFEMTAAGLTNNGSRRWLYRYTGPGSRLGQAYDLAVAGDRNLVVAGTTWDIVTANDFAVLGVSDSGTCRWAYRIADSGIGIARAVVCDRDGNAYACGTTTTDGYGQLTVANLSPIGAEQWLWSSGTTGEAMAIALDSTGRIYLAGYEAFPERNHHFTVWQLDWPGAIGLTLGTRSRDTAVAVAVGSDGNVYAAGHMDMGATGPDVAVISFDTSRNFTQRWFYSYDYAGGIDQTHALLCGRDGNVYVAGFGFLADSAGVAFIVLSLTGGGQFRWVYSDTGGRAAAFNAASGLAEDTDGNLYVCGTLAGTESTHMDAVVTSLTSEGGLRWRYMYARPDTGSDNFSSITFGPDGNLYACGTTGDPPNSDWIVVGLNTSGGVADEFHATLRGPRRPTIARELPLDNGERLSAAVFDVTGRRVETRRLATGVYLVRNQPGRLRRVLVMR